MRLWFSYPDPAGPSGGVSSLPVKSSMSIRRFCSLRFLRVAVVLIAAGSPVLSWAVGFQPLSPDELKMTSEPKAPGAPAVILFREVYRDDNGRTSHEDNYYRIKCLAEEGRKFADVAVEFAKGNDVVNVHARTIQPDGSVAEFDGKIFEKTIVKARGRQVLATTFTLPAVKVGSIIEYFY